MTETITVEPNKAEPRTPRIFCVGHVALDMMFHIDAMPSTPTKVSADHFLQSVGGMSANAAVAAARLGAKVRFAGPVGDDDAANVFAAHFAREGVDASLMVRLSGSASSVSAILVDKRGERYIFNRRGDALKQPPPFDLDWLKDTDVLMADPRCPVWCESALRGARSSGLLSVFDGDVAPKADLERLVPFADWAVFSSPGLAAYAPDATHPEHGLAKALAAGARCAVVTHGEHGIWWMRPGSPAEYISSYKVLRVVDTTGAGDVFHAALAVALAEGREDRDALRFASYAAALKCQRTGGVLGAPERNELERSLEVAA
jgi:sulfofructose kinase